MVFADFLVIGKEQEATEFRLLAVEADLSPFHSFVCAAKVKTFKANVSAAFL